MIAILKRSRILAPAIYTGSVIAAAVPLYLDSRDRGIHFTELPAMAFTALLPFAFAAITAFIFPRVAGVAGLLGSSYQWLCLLVAFSFSPSSGSSISDSIFFGGLLLLSALASTVCGILAFTHHRAARSHSFTNSPMKPPNLQSS